MTDSTNDLFETLARILLRCWLFGLLLLLFWAGVFLLASDVIHDVHGSMFHLTAHELDSDPLLRHGLRQAGRDPDLLLSVAGDSAGVKERSA